jgi:hypothetical protein
VFSAIDLLLGLAGLAVPVVIAFACWRLVATGSRHEESVQASLAHADAPVVHAGNIQTVAVEPVLESR